MEPRALGDRHGRPKVGALAGSPADKYAELPAAGLPIVVVLMASMAMFFTPAIGFVMVFYALYAKLTGKAGGEAAPQADPAAPKQVELPKG
jgi:hypothetical protein